MITIFSGGSGNDAILKALISMGYTTKDIRIIVNAYDNGKSTGVCRSVTNTLGVSDIRKNHFKLYKYTNNNIDESIIKFYTERLNLNNSKDIRKSVHEFLNSLNLEFDFTIHVDTFFDLVHNNYNFNDFSVSNIVYSIMYKTFGYDYTNKFFCDMLGIDDCVLLNSYDNVYIYAKTQNDEILGEEDIVDLCDKDNKIKKLYFSDEEDCSISSRSIECILNSDVLIISTGTFWSSLYPTFSYGDLYKFINLSKANKLWFMDTAEDKDAYGVTDKEFINYMSNLGLYVSDFTIVENNDACESLRSFEDGYFKIVRYNFGNINGKNNPELIQRALSELI